MRLIPRSIRGRLLALSAVATALALGVAGLAIGGILERFVTETIDARLSDRLLALETAVRADGSIDAATAARLDARIGPNEPWRIDTPRGSAGTRASDGTLVLTFADQPEVRRGPHRPGFDRGPRPPALPDGARVFEARLRAGPPVHGLTVDVATDAGAATIMATVPHATIERPIRTALLPLAASLLVLGIALALASWVQLRVGLRPLVRLREDVAGVRAGRIEQLPADQPDELAPLATELNALVADNRAALANARGHVANLAHGLKTPLATLALGLREPGADPGGSLSAAVARIERAIRHHLGRARADSVGNSRARVALAPAVDGVVTALSRIHAERAVTATSAIATDLTVAIDPHDLDELLGNLLDNAWRFAATRVAIDAVVEDKVVLITITDDGPGIAPALRAAAMQPGRRLDEAGDGHGFGLSIARELAEMHGGTLMLEDAPEGGLSATVELPR